jgi:hypothetical protein
MDAPFTVKRDTVTGYYRLVDDYDRYATVHTSLINCHVIGEDGSRLIHRSKISR